MPRELKTRADLIAERRELEDALRSERGRRELADGYHDQCEEENKRLAASLETLHKRIRGLAVDLGAMQTDDAVEDVRRAAEGMREVCEAVMVQVSVFEEEDAGPYKCEQAILRTRDAAIRLAEVRKGESDAHEG